MRKLILPDVVSGVELVTDVNTHVVDHIMVFQDSIELNCGKRKTNATVFIDILVAQLCQYLNWRYGTGKLRFLV